jgi:hypothetical protein
LISLEESDEGTENVFEEKHLEHNKKLNKKSTRSSKVMVVIV